MPSDWKLVTRSYKGNDRCQILVYALNANGAKDMCHGMGDAPFRQYHGGGYSFINTKRDMTDTCDGLGGACSKSVKPDTLYLQDGQKYAITHIGEDVLDQLVRPSRMFPGIRVRDYLIYKHDVPCSELLANYFLKYRSAYAWNGTATADTPEIFDAYKIE
jgi:hypothetical protein